MRKVFTSPRLENVEAVAEMLRAQGIAVKIAEGRSYSGSRRSRFSYRTEEDAAPQPSVWIVHAADQPRGRQFLRDAGLLESSRVGQSRYLPLSLLDREESAASVKARRTTRLKLGLLGLIAVVIGLVYFAKSTSIQAPSVPQVTRAPAAKIIIEQVAGELTMYRVDVPSALAKLLIESEIKARKPEQACIAIDGKDPAPGFIQALAAGNTQVFPASACPGEAAWDVGVHDYMTDGTGTGNVQLTLDADAARVLEVEREGTRWRILRMR